MRTKKQKKLLKRFPEEDLRLPEELECNLSDFALFLAVMKDPEAHRCVLSIIMHEPQLSLRHIHVENVILNRSGQRAIRLDATAQDIRNRNFATEMQNDTVGDDIRRRSRFYQSLLDAPLLKSGRSTRYRNLPSSIIIFITQDDLFGGNRAEYTFQEQCREIAGLSLGDGTTKLFLNMASKNGDPVLVSLLQYMKDTRLDNPEVLVRDDRIRTLDRIVQEVKQSEEWEDIKMDLYTMGIERGREYGRKEGMKKGLARGHRKGHRDGRLEGLRDGRLEGLRDGRLEGLRDGRLEGLRDGRLEGIRAVIALCRQMGLAEQETEKKLQEQFSLSAQEAREELARSHSKKEPVEPHREK